MIEIELSFFGRFRRLRAEEGDRLQCEPGVNVAEIKRLLGERWKGQDSFEDAVLATEERILGDEERIFQSARLVLLPPVCGG